MTWSPDIVIYHAPCDDGFGAAWACHRRWPDAIYYPATYGKPAPDVAGMSVLIVDFSFKRPVLEEMLCAGAEIVILDHHKTAREDLAPYAVEMCGDATLSPEDMPGMFEDALELERPACFALFDMSKSGARLAWEFCFPLSPAPMLVRLIEDRDLWRFALEETQPFSLWLRSHGMDFEVWDAIHEKLHDPVDRQDIFAQAIGMQAFYNQKIAELVREARMRNIGGFDVPVVNCSWAFASDVAHQLLADHPAAPFAACYYDRGDGQRSFSLRSEDDRVDVSVIARAHGGGGHRNAAGFEVALP